jgi:hypothetical protein
MCRSPSEFPNAAIGLRPIVIISVTGHKETVLSGLRANTAASVVKGLHILKTAERRQHIQDFCFSLT